MTLDLLSTLTDVWQYRLPSFQSIRMVAVVLCPWQQKHKGALLTSFRYVTLNYLFIYFYF